MGKAFQITDVLVYRTIVPYNQDYFQEMTLEEAKAYEDGLDEETLLNMFHEATGNGDEPYALARTVRIIDTED